MSSDQTPRRGANTGGGTLTPHAEEPSDHGLLAEIDLQTAHRLRDERVVASGGMGDVVRALDRSLRRWVAKKTIHTELRTDPRSQRSFVREARITAQLDHPHIVPVHDIGVDPLGKIFFTMKLVEGQTLSALIDELLPGRLPHDTLLNLLDIVVKICDALSFAHSRGVLHGDVKPGNIMVGDFGQVYLMDWGVARLLPESDAPTAERVQDPLPVAFGEPNHAVYGTPSHMSPEQALGATDQLSERSDVFLLGSLLYHVVTRRPPYEGDTVMATLVMAAEGRVTPIEACPGGDETPRELRRIIAKAMAFEPSDRHRSVEALKEDLVRFIRGVVDFPRTTAPEGHVVIREGDVGEAAYRIVSGRCEVSIGGERVREMGPGESFGETAILSPGPRTATVVALEPMVLEVITREELERELSSMRPWMASFIRTLADRFREREER